MGVVVGVLVLVFQQPIQELQNKPKIFYEVQSADFPEVCPKDINFGDGTTTTFGINYKNVGKVPGDLTVRLYSNDIYSRQEGCMDQYQNASYRVWNMEPGKTEQFLFRLKMKEPYLNLTLMTIATCSYDTTITQDRKCGSLTTCCHYKKGETTNNYFFVRQGC